MQGTNVTKSPLDTVNDVGSKDRNSHPTLWDEKVSTYVEPLLTLKCMLLGINCNLSVPLDSSAFGFELAEHRCVTVTLAGT